MLLRQEVLYDEQVLVFEVVQLAGYETGKDQDRKNFLVQYIRTTVCQDK